MSFLTKSHTKTFTVVLLILLVGVFAIVLSSLNWQQSVYEGWGQWLFYSMYLYLVFIFFRTAIHLMLCFANTFFEKVPPKLQEYPLVSVIIPCYNEEKVVRKAVQSALSLTYPNYEIIIVDDGSIDATLDIATNLKRHGKVRIINQQNAGKAMALNRGIAEALGEYFLCMDADSVLSPGALELGLSYLHGNSNIGAVAGTVEIGNVNNTITSFQKLEYVTGLNLFKVAQSYLEMVTVIPGPIGIFRKSVVQKVGNYKDSTYAEDCELTLRILLTGYGVIYIPGMIAVTEAPEDFSSLVAQRYRWSRGVVQAIRENIKWIFLPHKNLRNFMVVFYMSIESIFIPTANFIFAIISIEFVLYYGTSEIFGQFFLQLMTLDLILTVFCIANEAQTMMLIPYSILNRVTYGLGLEILRFFAVIDEVLGLPMSWVKLARKGL